MEKLHTSLLVGVVIFYVAAGISIVAIISQSFTERNVQAAYPSHPVQPIDASVSVDSDGEIPRTNGSGAARIRGGK